ncbi:MAG TPA: hypothetical protein VF469_37535 [Kofleriaceae bacterium]
MAVYRDRDLRSSLIGGQRRGRGPRDAIAWQTRCHRPIAHRIRTLLKNETRRIVPGHDPIIWERHPSWIIGGENNQVAELNLADSEKSRRIK